MYGNAKLTNSAEVFLKDFATGKLSFFGCITETGMNKTIDSTDLRCGMDAGLAGIAYTNPDMTLTIATIAWNDYLIQLQNDEEWEEDVELNIPINTGVVTLTNDDGDGVFTFDPLISPVGDKVYFQDTRGKSYDVAFDDATGVATVAGVGAIQGSFSYLVEVANAQTFDFNTDSLPKSTGIVLHHVARDIASNEPIADVYFEFDNVVGDGNLDLNMAINDTAGTSVTLRALPSSGKFMRQIYVPK